MSLIDSTYFVREISLPEGKYKPISDFITRYENRVIYDLFGYTLGNLIIAYSAGSEQRIKDIVEGKEYEVTCYDGYYFPAGGDVPVKWNGLVNDNKVSLLAYWIYYWWCRETAAFVTNVGGAKSKLENATVENFSAKAVYAWREMYNLYGFSDQDMLVPSCYNFMSENKETYPEWVFKPKGNINRFGI